MEQKVFEGQTVRYNEQGTGSAIGGSDSRSSYPLAIVNKVHSNGAVDLTVLSPTGILQKTAVPTGQWSPTEFTNQLNKAFQNS